jgi:hypothetical protein
MTKRDPEVVADDRQLRKDEEIADIEAFLNAYVRATGEVLEVEDHYESPDAICVRPDGTIVGVEHTMIRRSPEDALWDSILEYRDEMDIVTTSEELIRLIFKKAELRQKFSTEHNMLLIAVYESDLSYGRKWVTGPVRRRVDRVSL